MASQDELLELLANIQQQPLSSAPPLDKDEVAKALLLRLSGYARTLEDIQRGGQAIINGGDAITTLSDPKQDIAQDFHWASFGMAVFNFIRIPSLYLYAYLLGHDLPFSWANTVQWGYAATFLGLSIICLLVPPVAPGVAFTLAGIALVNSTYFLIQAISQSKSLIKEKKELEEKIKEAELEGVAIKKEASAFAQQMKEEYAQDPKAITDKVTQLHERFLRNGQTLQELHKKLAETEQLAKELSGGQIRQRYLRVLLASLSVIGLVTALFFPPVGLGILAGVTLFSTAYFILPFMYNKVQSLRKKGLAPSDMPTEQPDVSSAAVLDRHPSSTSITLQDLAKHPVSKKASSPSTILHDESLDTKPKQQTLSKIFSQSHDSLCPHPLPSTETEEEEKKHVLG